MFWMGILIFIIGFAIRSIYRQKLIKTDKNAIINQDEYKKIRDYKLWMNIGLIISLIGIVLNLLSLLL